MLTVALPGVRAARPRARWLPGPAAACCGWRNGLSWRITPCELTVLHWGSNGRQDTVPLLSLPRREGPPGQAGHRDTPCKPRDGRSHTQLPGSHQTLGAHPCSRLGQGRGCQHCSTRRNGVSSCPRAPAAPGIVGNYGTAVKYKLGKNHLWRPGQCVSEPWGAPAPCRQELPSGPLAWLFALPLFLGLHERERDR